MLGKLLKYEWKGLRKPLMILYLVLLGITILTGILILTINPEFDDVAVGFSVLFTMLGVFLYYFGIIACSMGTMLIIAIRFYRTCYTDEAYLTHTLPVSTKQLVSAKTIMAVLCHLLTMLVIIVSAVLLVGIFITHMINLGEIQASDLTGLVWNDINTEFRELFGIGFVGYFLYFGLYGLIGSICGIISVLGCVSLGQLYTKHRILGAIIAYFALTAIQQFISYIAMIPMYGKLFEAEYAGETVTMFSVMQPSLIIILIQSIVVAVVMYFINLHMMTKRLNLE